MDIADFWENINSLIKNRKTTQRAISKECGFTERRIETLVSTGRLPDAFEVQKIAQALETTAEYLITGKLPEGLEPEIFAIALKMTPLSSESRKEIDNFVEIKINIEYHEKKLAEYEKFDIEHPEEAARLSKYLAEQGEEPVVQTPPFIIKEPPKQPEKKAETPKKEVPSTKADEFRADNAVATLPKK